MILSPKAKEQEKLKESTVGTVPGDIDFMLMASTEAGTTRM